MRNDLPPPSTVADMCALRSWCDHVDDDTRLLLEMAADTVRALSARVCRLARKLEVTEADRERLVAVIDRRSE